MTENISELLSTVLRSQYFVTVLENLYARVYKATGFYLRVRGEKRNINIEVIQGIISSFYRSRQTFNRAITNAYFFAIESAV